MTTPDPSHPADPALLARIEAVEVSVQEIRFQHLVKVDATQNGLGIVYGQVQRIQQELTGFRAEVAAHMEAQDVKLDEILRRLPPAAGQ